MDKDEIAIEGIVTFAEPDVLKTADPSCSGYKGYRQEWRSNEDRMQHYDIKSAYPKVNDFAVVGILNAQVWFSGTMPGVERGSKIKIRGKLDGWIVRVERYEFINPTVREQCVMDTLAQGGKVHYLDDGSIITSGGSPMHSSKPEESAMFWMLKKVSKSEKDVK